jgi:hypothetical protein
VFYRTLLYGNTPGERTLMASMVWTSRLLLPFVLLILAAVTLDIYLNSTSHLDEVSLALLLTASLVITASWLCSWLPPPPMEE